MGVDRDVLADWVARYEQLWRTAGTERLGDLFTRDVRYSPAPWTDPIVGIDALAAFWEGARASAAEEFTLVADIVALDHRVGIVRVAVDYAGGDRWRDLWVVTLTDDGRCSTFEEWPFASEQRTGHE